MVIIRMIIACIPAYNEESTIARVILQTRRFVDKVLVCDDGSEDMTSDIAEGLGAVLIRHHRNLGYGASLRSLFDRALDLGADIVITIDADAQHNPQDIPRLINPIQKDEADIVIGTRFSRRSEEESIPQFRRLGIRAITTLTEALSGGNISDAQSGFRSYSRRAIKLVRPAEEGMGASTEILLKALESGLKIAEVQTAIVYPGEKTSTQNPVFQILDVVGSTIKYASIRHPLIFYGLPAAIALIVGIAFAVWAVQLYSVEGRLVTNIALISLGALLIGLILGAIAIILYTLISVLRSRM